MREYDYDQELLYWRDGDTRIRLGSAGSIIMVCPICGEEHFREKISENESCFKGHGRMEPLTEANEARYRELWEKNGDTLTTVEERRKQRLDEEAKQPHLYSARNYPL
jgi:hypothetical protein